MSCGVGCRRTSDLVLLWLWHRPVATAPIRPLAWEPPYAARVALERQKKFNPSLYVFLIATNNMIKLHIIINMLKNYKGQSNRLKFFNVFPMTCLLYVYHHFFKALNLG